MKLYIDALLQEIVEPAYKVVPFIGAALRMQVTLQPEWLEAAWQMFIVPFGAAALGAGWPMQVGAPAVTPRL